MSLKKNLPPVACRNQILNLKNTLKTLNKKRGSSTHWTGGKRRKDWHGIYSWSAQVQYRGMTKMKEKNCKQMVEVQMRKRMNKMTVGGGKREKQE